GSLHQNVTTNADPRWCVTDGSPVTAWNEDGSPSPDGMGGNEGLCTVAVDPTDPNATFAQSFSLDFNAAGTLAYASEPYFGEVFEFSRTPGQPQLTTIHSTTLGFDSPTDVVVSKSTGNVYVSYNSTNNPGEAVVAAFTPTLGLINCISESGGGGCAKGFGLTGANALALSPDESHLYVTGQLDSSIAELTIGPNGGLSQPPSNGKNDCAATGGAENCISVGGATVHFTVTGANPTSGTGTTNSSGKATFEYTGTHTGQDTIVACYDADKNGTCGDNGDATSNRATKTWTAGADLSITKTDSP